MSNVTLNIGLNIGAELLTYHKDAIERTLHDGNIYPTAAVNVLKDILHFSAELVSYSLVMSNSELTMVAQMRVKRVEGLHTDINALCGALGQQAIAYKLSNQADGAMGLHATQPPALDAPWRVFNIDYFIAK